MRCIVIDDEPYALDLMKGYVVKTEGLELVASFSSPLKARTFIMENYVDLIFLDINMPEISGIEFLDSLNIRPLVIFTTAHKDYGAMSYEYDAVDYLLKPIKYERFLKAVAKIKEQTKSENHSQKKDSKEVVILKSGTKSYRLSIEEILYAEASGNYVIVYTKFDKIMCQYSMKDFLSLLPADSIVRIHKSFAVSVDKIEIVESDRVTVAKKVLPVGLTYRQAVNHILNKD